MKKLLLSSVLCSLFLANSAFADNSEFYNRNKKEDDILINMPCDIKMAFKKVYTSYKQNKVYDTSFNGGNINSDDYVAQSRHKLYVQGAFTDSKGIYFLMSKYEVSSMQYDAIMKEKCPNINRVNALPVVNISWFDAISYTKDITKKVQKLKDPFFDKNKQAFIRLPTESEWEFASRGGLNVSLAELESPLPPMQNKSLRDFAFYQGTDSSNGKVNLSGLLLANPLDLYDMLGNVQEIMLTPFNATRTNRLHGQSGGFVVRGGGFLTNADNISHSLRIEKPLFINGNEVKAKDIGMRLVISAPVVQSRQDLLKLNEDIALLGMTDEDNNENDKNIAKLDAIIKENKAITEANKAIKEEQEANAKEKDILSKKNEYLLKSLNELRESLISVNVAREELRDKNIVASIRLGGHLCAYISSAKNTYNYDKGMYDKFNSICKKNDKFDRCKALGDLKNKYEGEGAVLNYFINYYADHLVETSTNYEKKHIKALVNKAKAEVTNITKDNNTNVDVGKNMNKYVDIFLDDVFSFKNGNNIDKLKMQIEKKCGI